MLVDCGEKNREISRITVKISRLTGNLEADAGAGGWNAALWREAKLFEEDKYQG